jgi:CheY-like chemotaxis protein
VLDIREIAVRQLASGGGQAPASPGAPGRRTSADTPGPAARPRVLVVEDSVGVRELQRVILEGAGYDVLTAVDGLDGAARLSQDPVDLVLSDVEMPGMDGFTLTRTLRRTRGWEDVPVVIMTSRGDPADQRAGLDAGASAYLLKSEFDQAELIDTVRRLLGR